MKLSKMLAAVFTLACSVLATESFAQRLDIDLGGGRDAMPGWYQSIHTGRLCKLDLRMGPLGRTREATLNCIGNSRDFLGGLRVYTLQNARFVCNRGVCSGLGALTMRGDSFDYGAETYVLSRMLHDVIVPSGTYTLFNSNPSNGFYYMQVRTMGPGLVVLQRADGVFHMQCDSIVGTCVDPTGRMWPMAVWINPANPYEVRLGFRNPRGGNYNVWYVQGH